MGLSLRSTLPCGKHISVTKGVWETSRGGIIVESFLRGPYVFYGWVSYTIMRWTLSVSPFFLFHFVSRSILLEKNSLPPISSATVHVIQSLFDSHNVKHLNFDISSGKVFREISCVV